MFLRFQPDSLLQGFPNVSPIALPPNCATECCGVCPPGNKITVVGWGVYDLVNNAIPENLLQVQKDIIDRGLCDSIWGDITSRMFCTNAENGIDSCNGDSGGNWNIKQKFFIAKLWFLDRCNYKKWRSSRYCELWLGNMWWWISTCSLRQSWSPSGPQLHSSNLWCIKNSRLWILCENSEKQ